MREKRQFHLEPDVGMIIDLEQANEKVRFNFPAKQDKELLFLSGT